MKRIVMDYVKTYAGLLLIFFIGMQAVYLIPNEKLEPYYSKSLSQVEKEEKYENPLFNSDASILDNFMDSLMIQTCHISDAYESSFSAAMDNNGYPRYWNGYLLTLRPLMTMFSWQQIRYINMLLLLTLFCFCFSGIHAKLGTCQAFGFAISILSCFLVLAAESLQYFSVFMITFAEILLIVSIPTLRETHKASLLLFAGGMCVNFFDLLTAPLLTLGMPLLVLCGFRLKQEKDSLPLWRFVLCLSIAWCLGYAGCWVMKWLIGSLILNQNVFKDAMSTAKFRIEGSEAYPLNRMEMLRLNFSAYFFAKGKKPFLLILLSLAYFLFRMLYSKSSQPISGFFITLAISLYPYIWFFVFANHSQLHYFYTYRIQAITLFALYIVIGSRIHLQKNEPVRS